MTYNELHAVIWDMTAEQREQDVSVLLTISGTFLSVYGLTVDDDETDTVRPYLTAHA